MAGGNRGQRMGNPRPEVIRFDAAVYGVRVLSEDHGIRITLDMAEDCIPEMAMLAEVKRQGMILTFEAKVSEGRTR